MRITPALLSGFKISRTPRYPYPDLSHLPKPLKPVMTSIEPPVKPLQGLIAINKPEGVTSAEAVRKAIDLFSASSIFAPTISLLAEAAEKNGKFQKQRRRKPTKPAEVKCGHGGTLDPMATGVLVLGIGNGTKQLQQYLNGFKTYETVALFGAETDTYDGVGKVIRKAGWEGVTKEKIEEALGQFRGMILQKPPLYSALHHEGKRYYEYAREGLPLPVEIKKREVVAETMDLVKFELGTEHKWRLPEEEVDAETKLEASALKAAADGKKLEIPEKTEAEVQAEAEVKENTGDKRPAPEDEGQPAKKAKKDYSKKVVLDSTKWAGSNTIDTATYVDPKDVPPAVTLSMRVGGGFYVRSLIQDLGEAVGSAAHMVKLARTQQGSWEVGKNCFEWDELFNQPESSWAPMVEKVFRAFDEGKVVGADEFEKWRSEPKTEEVKTEEVQVKVEEPVAAAEKPAEEPTEVKAEEAEVKKEE